MTTRNYCTGLASSAGVSDTPLMHDVKSADVSVHIQSGESRVVRHEIEIARLRTKHS